MIYIRLKKKKKPQREICPGLIPQKVQINISQKLFFEPLVQKKTMLADFLFLIFFFLASSVQEKNVIGTMPLVIPRNNSNAINHVHRLGFLMCLKCGYLHFGVRLFRCARLFSQARHS